MELSGINSSIEHCRAMIAAGERVDLYKPDLERLLKVKAELEPDYAAGEPAGLSDNVYKRIWVLKQLVEYGELIPESCKVNKDAVLKAYRSGSLGAEPGMVSYWVDGRMVADRRPFDWDECSRLLKENEGHAFWLEEPLPIQTLMPSLSIPPSNATRQHNVWLGIANEGSTCFVPRQFMEDSGAAITHILDTDLPAIDQAGGTRRFVQDMAFQTAAGVVWRPVYVMIARLLGQHYQNAPNPQAAQGLQQSYVGDRVIRLRVCVAPTSSTGGMRLLSPFLWEFYFKGSAPDGQGNLVISTNKTGLV